MKKMSKHFTIMAEKTFEPWADALEIKMFTDRKNMMGDPPRGITNKRV